MKNLPDNILSELDELILKLDEDQLRIINRKVVERINLIHKAKNLMGLSRFNLGDRVYFLQNGNKKLGKIIRLNQRTATVFLDDGHEWLIAPSFLMKE